MLTFENNPQHQDILIIRFNDPFKKYFIFIILSLFSDLCEPGLVNYGNYEGIYNFDNLTEKQPMKCGTSCNENAFKQLENQNIYRSI